MPCKRLIEHAQRHRSTLLEAASSANVTIQSAAFAVSSGACAGPPRENGFGGGGGGLKFLVHVLDLSSEEEQATFKAWSLPVSEEVR